MSRYFIGLLWCNQQIRYAPVQQTSTSGAKVESPFTEFHFQIKKRHHHLHQLHRLYYCKALNFTHHEQASHQNSPFHRQNYPIHQNYPTILHQYHIVKTLVLNR